MATTIYDKSVFAKYFNSDDAAVLAWAANVLEKLVADGTVASYILKENEAGEESDFEDLFEPVCIFFSYFVQLARTFELFKEDQFLADQYLQNRGQFTCGEETLAQLTYLIQNSLKIRSQRGTSRMVNISEDADVPHGELLRLICWNSLVFFKFGVARPQYNGWNVDHCGPAFRGCTGRYDLNIGYEYTEDIEDLSLYPLINSDLVFLTRYRGKNCLEIEQTPFGESAGIGANESGKRIVVDPRFNFEITFYVAQDITLENISFGCLAFDSVGDQISLLDITDGSNSNHFFETRRLNKAGEFYFVRGILYNKDRDLLSADEARLNIGFGHQLKMTENVASIIPYIVVDNDMTDDSDDSEDNFDSDSFSTAIDGSGSSDGNESYDGVPSVFLWNVKVTPCALKYERCYLDNKNFIDLIIDNKNGKYSDQQIDVLLRKYFIPYNTAFKTTNLGDLGDANPDTSLLLLEDGDYILFEDDNRIKLE